MPERNGHKDKAAAESSRPLKKPPGYRRLQRLLKQVLNAPPLRKEKRQITAAPPHLTLEGAK